MQYNQASSKYTISVIIPVYNIEEYVDKCIMSLINQTYTNIEIILVDDCSQDCSGEICDKYANNDKRIIVIHNKFNQGLAETRNIGMHFAKGEIVSFIDGDDFLDLDAYEKMIALMDEDIDIVSCGINNLFPKSGIMHNYVSYKCHDVTRYSRNEAITELLSLKTFSFSCCDKIFRKKLFDCVEFQKGMVCEDVFVLYKLFKKSRNIVNLGQSKYNYVYRKDSLSRKKFDITKMNFCFAAEEIYEDIKTDLPQFENLGHAVYINNTVSVLEEILQTDDKKTFYKQIFKLKLILVKNFINIKNNNEISSQRKKYYYSMITKL